VTKIFVSGSNALYKDSKKFFVSERKEGSREILILAL
jgi:hypothetical protein